MFQSSDDIAQTTVRQYTPHYFISGDYHVCAMVLPIRSTAACESHHALAAAWDLEIFMLHKNCSLLMKHRYTPTLISNYICTGPKIYQPMDSLDQLLVFLTKSSFLGRILYGGRV